VIRRFVTLAFGGEQYQRFAENLALSAAPFGFPVILVTSKLAKPNPSLFDRIIRVDCGGRIEDVWALKLSLDRVLTAAGVEGDVAFLDADAFITGDPAPVFAPLAACGFYFPVEQTHGPEWPWAFSRPMGGLAQEFCGHQGQFPQLNGGFFAWSQGSPIAARWFDASRRALAFLREKGLDREEPAMALALCSVPETQPHWFDWSKVCQLWCAAHEYTASLQHEFVIARMPWWPRIERPVIVHHGSGYAWSERYASMARGLIRPEKPDNPPEVALVILTHARTTWLQEALFSALQQDYPRLTVFVLNDCREQTLASDNPRIRVVNFTERFASLGEKRNAVFSGAVQGDLVAFLDDDDLLAPWHISEHVANLSRKPAAVASLSLRCLSFDREGQRLSFGSAPIDVMFRRSTQARFPPVTTGEDQDFRAALAADGVIADMQLPNPSYIYGWANGVHHVSGNPARARVGYDEDVKRRMRSGEEPTGLVRLVPQVRDDIAHWWGSQLYGRFQRGG
jgi:hypothetical protein